MVTVSSKALDHIISLMMEKDITPDTHSLRVGVKGGGCSGLSYIMDFDDKVDPLDEIVKTKAGLNILIDKKSVLYLFGTELDFSDGLNGKGFQFINPNASRTCGCGESFAV
jgi:iron-sulfur cluster assembly protein